MQTMAQRFPLKNCGLAAFNLAGFQWPRYVAALPAGSQVKRLERYKESICSPYYHAPKPVARDHGQGFYLESQGMPGLRWHWCDEVECVSIRHKGWFTNEFQDSTIRGIVFTLPHGRGFLAGWSMGEHMASFLECEIYETAREAAYAADSLAENAAEKQREFEEAERERLESEGDE